MTSNPTDAQDALESVDAIDIPRGLTMVRDRGVTRGELARFVLTR
jgi:hypothetical protein